MGWADGVGPKASPEYTNTVAYPGGRNRRAREKKKEKKKMGGKKEEKKKKRGKTEKPLNSSIEYR